MLTVHSLTHPGKTRPLNEDALMSDPAIGLIAVADGMGGHNAGEVASQMALESLHGFLRRSAEGDRLTFSSVGDSRLYELRGGELHQLSRDDSWVVMLSEQSGIDPATLEKHPMRHVLTNVIGARPDVDPPIREIVLEDDHVIVLCTDGLH